MCVNKADSLDNISAIIFSRLQCIRFGKYSFYII